MIDERFFGTVTAYVPGPEAANYRFTSGLAVQILKLLAPTLQPLLHSPDTSASEDMHAGVPVPPSDLPYL